MFVVEALRGLEKLNVNDRKPERDRRQLQVKQGERDIFQRGRVLLHGRKGEHGLELADLGLNLLLIILILFTAPAFLGFGEKLILIDLGGAQALTQLLQFRDVLERGLEIELFTVERAIFWGQQERA